MPEPVWDETFMELTMDDVKESIELAARSRRRLFEETTTISNARGEVITITVRKERRR